MSPDGTNLNATALGEFLAKNQNGDWKSKIPKIVSACEAVVNGSNIPSFTSGKLTCPGKAAVMLQCVQFAIIDVKLHL